MNIFENIVPASALRYHLNQQHGIEPFPFCTCRNRLPEDFPAVLAHWQDSVELIQVEEGSGVVKIDLNDYPVRAGDLILVLPGQLHSISCPDKGRLVYHSVLFSPSLLSGGRGDPCIESYLLPIRERRLLLPVLTTPQDSWYSAFRSCLEDAGEISLYYPIGWELAVKSRLFQILYILIYNRLEGDPGTYAGKGLEKIKSLLMFLTAHYRERLKIEDMAEYTQLSESYLMKLFHQATDMTFIEYLNDFRLDAGCSLLSTTDLSILDVARQCGFENAPYFNRLFKRKYGVTPTAFRKRSGHAPAAEKKETE